MSKHFEWDEEKGDWAECEKKAGRSRFVSSIGGWVHINDFPTSESVSKSAAIVRDTGEIYSKTPSHFNDMLKELDKKTPKGLGPTTLNYR